MLYVPALQGVHADAPDGLVLPAGHCEHGFTELALTDAPGTDEYEPAAHNVHTGAPPNAIV